MKKYNKYGTKIAKEGKIILKTGRFDNMHSTVIISSISKAVQNCKERKPLRSEVIRPSKTIYCKKVT